jgi:shikimate 5-dehydrogenase
MSAPAFAFLGVTTAASSIQRIFPAWMTELGLDTRLVGFDFAPGSPREAYRPVLERIKTDPAFLGGLITTHKLAVLDAGRDLFDDLGESARTLHEVSCIAKRDGRMIGHALDDRTSALALEALLGDRFWEAGGELLILGAGGASVATVLGQRNRAAAGAAIGAGAPRRVHVTARGPERLAELDDLVARTSPPFEVVGHVTPRPEDTDALVAALPSRSVVVNATGMGKDRPGSPLTDRVRFPEAAVAWDMNYRGERLFLQQAAAQPADSGVVVADGWDYFVYSWTQVVSVVHEIDIPASGPLFDRLSAIAREVG